MNNQIELLIINNLPMVCIAIWAVLFIIATVATLLDKVPSQYSIPAMVGTLGAGIVAAAYPVKKVEDVWLSLLIEVLIAVVCFVMPLVWYSKAGKLNRDHRIKKGASTLRALVGERCLVVEDISNIHEKGLVKHNGTVWSAKMLNPNDYVEEGTIVVVNYVEGVKLVCTREK